ncbi:hypothetical protein GUJ93_ZPchr0002g23351 [Zizania palustris]|uniref:Uncharacterized protein n=1 Tax=Zizania palustris TaxID=103762 RepID=A0A8J5VH31_ZIZPA|nr:hypothetical protein GUJ93_ZPchr0002g23351 [Zizania palustris]
MDTTVSAPRCMLPSTSRPSTPLSISLASSASEPATYNASIGKTLRPRSTVRSTRPTPPFCDIFANERRLCFLIFHGLPILNITVISMAATALATHDTPFAEPVKGATLQLFGFAEAISIRLTCGSHS